ncbi:helix-turn-helix domain-containing protein [Companilactobacillus metriopterae]|uniref:helix-turn-helix domain-containing protein n=1 Tax=Companilactobacillus metriopterae TaxID=1909267 RepID=UPI00100B9094|nr:helix-turn-helix domain-containing protein [Companilactobacillus metriopterae]
MEAKYLKQQAAADYGDVSYNTITNWTKKRGLAYIKIGKKRLYTTDNIDELLSKCSRIIILK